MATESIGLSVRIPAKPADVFAAWLDSVAHGAMTGGGRAKIDPRVGGARMAWDGYIRGETLELEPGRRIVQSWRTSEFPAESGASRLEITLIAEGDTTRLLLAHTEIPEGQGAQYQEGWVDHYFEPMSAYFTRKMKAPARKARTKKVTTKPAVKKAAVKKRAAKKPVATTATAKKSTAKVRKPAGKKTVTKSQRAKRSSTPRLKRGQRGK
jgi:uncharacterized protein YndB with AHSA1/START domain